METLFFRTTRNRRKGHYYESAWDAALQTSPRFVSITSFNEWHEGTQIEKAVPSQTKLSARKNFTYLDYAPNQPEFYLTLTKKWIKKFSSANVNAKKTLKKSEP